MGGMGKEKWILPIYYYFSNLACAWFTVTAFSLFIPKGPTAQAIAHVMFVGHG
jgi:hypothetical protein